MDISSEYAGKWWATFWWTRGVIGATTLSTVIPQFVELSQIQLLRGFHLFITRWNDFAAWLGGLIGVLPFLPELSPQTTNALLFASSISVPALFGVYFRESFLDNLKLSDLRKQWSELFVQDTAPVVRTIAWLVFLFNLFQVLALTVLLLIVLPLGIANGLAADLLAALISGSASTSSILMIALGIVAPLLIGVAAVRGFFRALVLTVTFLATFELLYHLNTPYLGDWVDRQHCQYVDPTGPECDHTS